MVANVDANTLVFGFFNGIEVSFSVGDCERKNGNIKVNNIKRIDEEKTGHVPKTLNLTDKRLETLTAKQNIRGYFAKNNHVVTATTKTETIAKAKKKEKKFPKIRRNHRNCFSRN